MYHGITPRTPTADRTAIGPRHTATLEPDEALRLLGTVALGRIVFTRHALPAVCPVNHIIDAGDIVLWGFDGGDIAALTAPDDCPGIVVAYEADAIDPKTDLGWSVVVTGYAMPVTDGRDGQRYGELLRPLIGGPMGRVLSIRPGLITGFRLEKA
ncbi:pyridoxamine 5'-phosphate oxidase family protein [Streptomyces sp. So13.3]|uniref:pyridoxamine 5'-phosphate oxidase family protein n=1 Tax=Streptomyces TaxID=1883 RepID=UPI001105F5C7|nr:MULTISPECIES: pyridoxamine 5'-phosphate oxidase family protein [Streptomyces]MCZ4101774.1 pyridoxamine 5'-phosphate oxidase family protein [Streptomyces sp. H39-C1]QNA77319.1 pyridoxamine 5'-phosphate oxidase family protein [Streptomyces sp. So13.3]